MDENVTYQLQDCADIWGSGDKGKDGDEWSVSHIKKC